MRMTFFGELKRRNVLRVGAAYVVGSWLIIQVVETIFPAFGFGDAAIRYVVVVLGIGLIPALVFAWAFEITPEGLKREKDVDRSQSITPHTGKKLDRIIMVVLAIALAYFAFDKFLVEPEREAEAEATKAAELEEARAKGRTEALVASYGDKSIAVLPFVDMSVEHDQEYMSDGIAEELLNLLAKIPELRVTSRSSAFSFKGKDLEIPEIAEQLNVAHVLEGSVRKAGDKVRITAQLIEARSDTHLWSETYDRKLDDIFAIQDEIAAKVVEQLKLALLGDAPKATEANSEAYALYLQARYLSGQVTAEAVAQSNALYQQALAIDPGFAAAWSGLARNYLSQAAQNLRPAEEGYTMAREAAKTALRIDPDNAAAYAMLGRIALSYDNNQVEAAKYYARAVALDPADVKTISNSTALLASIGRLDDAIELAEYVAARDPVNAIRQANLGLYYLYAGRWNDAIVATRNALRLSPGYIGAHNTLGVALLFQGDAEAALGEFALETGNEESRVQGAAIGHFALGQQDEFEARLKELIDRWGDRYPTDVAQVYAMSGDADKAFAWLDRAVAENKGTFGYVHLWPLYRPLYDDPRWPAFLARVGKAPEQLAAVEFDLTPPR